jgi:hypothetical protein
LPNHTPPFYQPDSGGVLFAKFTPLAYFSVSENTRKYLTARIKISV